jgi:serine protease Do
VPRLAPGVAGPKLKPITLGDATKLHKGSFLLALGSPFNAGRDATASASWGILSNTARRVQPSDAELRFGARQLRHYPTLLQLDSKLNLGLSGGAVVNIKGELVGITTDAASPAGFDAHAGYAIPVDAMTRRAIEALKEGREVEYGFLGISLDQQVPNQITKVEPNSPAAQGELIRGDTIVAVGTAPVNDAESLVLAVNDAPVGKPVRIELVRDGQVLQKTVLVSKLPVTGEVIATNRPTAWRGLRVDFVSALPYGPDAEEVLRAMAQGGVGVAEVESNSPAEAAGFKPGQVITKVDGKPVRTPAEFRAAVKGIEGEATLQTHLGPVRIPGPP